VTQAVVERAKAGGAVRRTVYVTTASGGLSDVTQDGDVKVLTWTSDVEDFEDDEELAAAMGLVEGLPAGLITAVTEYLDGCDWELESLPQAGPDRPWAFITFSEDDTFASEGAYSSPDVTVVYHDWSLWFADLRLKGMEPHDIDELTKEAEQLGPQGKAVALACIAQHKEQMEE